MELLAYTAHEAAQQVVNALSLGSVYALLALGVAAVFSILGLINFAHGELVTLSGMTVLSTIAALGLLTLFLRKSVRGLALRAAAEDFTMTRMMGIRANSVVMLAFLVSGLLAGLAAFFYIGAFGQIGYNYGFNPLLKG